MVILSQKIHQTNTHQRLKLLSFSVFMAALVFPFTNRLILLIFPHLVPSNLSCAKTKLRFCFALTGYC